MDLIAEAQSLLPHQFAKSLKLNALVRCLVKPFNEAKDELEKLHHGHYIDQAFGQSLDVMGALVDQKRLGMSDDDYRPWIKIAILRITNGGTALGLFTIMSVLYKKKPPITVIEYAPNHVYFTLFEMPNIAMHTFAAIIRSAMPIGTNTEFIIANPSSFKQGLSIEVNNTLPKFQFDITAFSQSCFADFYGSYL